MSSKYIDNRAYATSGYTLSGANQQITIGGAGVIGGTGISGGTNEAYTIVNRGTIAGLSMSGHGISLQDGGTVINSGKAALIEGYTYGIDIANAAGHVTNTGTIEVTDEFQSVGVLLSTGGDVTNTGAGALIEGYKGVVIENAAGKVVNSGKIEGLNNFSVGVSLIEGGTVTNAAGGFIQGSKAGIASLSGAVINGGTIEAIGSFSATSIGIYFAKSGSVTNTEAGALIKGGTGIYFHGGPGIVKNSGVIEGTGSTTSIGIILYTGGSVTNNKGGLIEGVRAGVLSASGAVRNSGRITANGTKGVGVYLDGNSSLLNNAGGVVRGVYAGVEASAAKVTNDGTIIGTKFGALLGYFDNAAKTSLLEGNIGVRLAGGGTVVNFGTIASTAGAKGKAVDFASSTDLLIDEAGSRFIGAVVGSLSTMELAGKGGTITGLGKQFTNFALVDELAAASWTFTGTNDISGVDELLLQGTSIIKGSLLNVGAVESQLKQEGGKAILDAGTRITVKAWENSKAAIILGTNVTFGGTFVETGAAISLDKHSLTFTFQTGLKGGAASGPGKLIMKGTIALDGFTVNKGATWQEFGKVTETAALTLGNAKGGAGALIIEKGGVVDITQNVGIAVAAGGKGALTITGTLEKTAGTGVSSIVPATVNNGTVNVTAGTLEFHAAVTGKGTDTIGKAGKLKFDAAVGANQTVKFATTTGGTLLLNDPKGNALGFAGTISGFKGRDKLDLTTFAFASKPKLAWTQTGAKGTLTVTDGAKIARITLFGQYMAAGFKAAADGTGGTAITYTPPAAVASLAAPHR